MKAFIAVILYGVIYTVSEAISAAMGIPHGITCYAILLYTAAVVFMLFYTGWFRRESAVPPQLPMTTLYASYALLAVLPVACLVFGIVSGSFAFNFNLFVLAICAAILEELFFRGFFIEWLREQMGFSLLVSIGLSALAFAFLHLANAPTAGAAAALLQALFALGVGIALGCAYTMFPRIAPCILLHILINVASFAGVSNVFVDIGEIVLAALVSVFLLITMQKGTQGKVSRRSGRAPQQGREQRRPRRTPQQDREQQRPRHAPQQGGGQPRSERASRQGESRHP